MTIEELTRALGAAVQADPSYLRLKSAKENNDNDQELQNDIGKLNLIRIQYNSELSKEQNKDSEKLKKLNKEFDDLYTEIMQNPNMVEYNIAKEQIDTLMNKITAILAMCVNGEDPQTCQIPENGCTGSCSTCTSCNE